MPTPPYTLNSYYGTVSDSTGLIVSPTNTQSDYDAYIAWVSSGNQPIINNSQPYQPIVAQAGWVKVALNNAGILSSINSYVTSLGGAVSILWDNSAYFQSNNTMILAWAATQSPAWTQSQIDAIFNAANTAMQASN